MIRGIFEEQSSMQTHSHVQEKKTYTLRTYGCQMNELDSEIMESLLQAHGYEKTEDEKDADLLLFNTCSIRDLAERKAMGKIGTLARRKKAHQIIGVTGCMANAKKETLFRKLPTVDFVLGTNNIHELINTIEEVETTRRPIAKTDTKFTYELDYETAVRGSNLSAYVSIIRGCDKYCTYCVVPYTRGPEVSRHPDAIYAECQKLALRGFKEITLLGQNVNSYGLDQPQWHCHFPDLLAKIDQIEGIERIRFMTSHPFDITTDLMYAIRDLPSLCNFVHFPFQAGSNRILKKMNRLYDKESGHHIETYIEKVEQFRSIVPNFVLGTDIIVGFPSETEEEFMETYNVFQQLAPSVAFIYAYSERDGTPAKRWKDDVPQTEKDARLQKLLQLHRDQTAVERETMLGSTVEVLFEGTAPRQPHLLKGRTRCWKRVLCEAPKTLLGTSAHVTLHAFTHETFLGTLHPPLKGSHN